LEGKPVPSAWGIMSLSVDSAADFIPLVPVRLIMIGTTGNPTLPITFLVPGSVYDTKDEATGFKEVLAENLVANF